MVANFVFLHILFHCYYNTYLHWLTPADVDSQVAPCKHGFGLQDGRPERRKYKCISLQKIFEPAHEIMALITQAISEGSGEPAHPRSLATAFAVCTHEVWK